MKSSLLLRGHQFVFIRGMFVFIKAGVVATQQCDCHSLRINEGRHIGMCKTACYTHEILVWADFRTSVSTIHFAEFKWCPGSRGNDLRFSFP